MGSGHSEIKSGRASLHYTKPRVKRHLNQLRKCRVSDSNISPPQICEEPIDIIFENFDLNAPQFSPKVRRSNRKRKFTDPLSADPKRKNTKQFFFFSEKNSWKGGVTYPFMDSSKFYTNRELSTLEEIGYSTDIRLTRKPSLRHHFSLYLVTSIYL